MSERQVKGTVVQILGDEYTIATEGDAAEVQRVAAYVDRKMQEIASGHSGRIAATQVAVLAAMEITVELFRTLKERTALTEKAHQNLDRLNTLIEEQASMSASLAERRSPPLERLYREIPVEQQD